MNPGFNDIERYIAGQMNQQEQHAFEKAMLDDPFLAEAVEGYLLQHNTQQARKDLQHLQQQLEAGATPVHRMAHRPKRWMQVAAGLAVVLIAAVVLVRLFSKEEEQQKVAFNPAKPEIDSIEQLPPTVSSVDSQAIAVLEPAQTTKLPVPETKAVPIIPETGIQEEEVAAKAKPSIADMPAVKTTRDEAAPAAKSPVANAQVTVMAKEDAAPSRMYRFSGRVTDATNSPLPYANIKEKTSGVGTYADHDGYFTIIAPDSIIEVETKALGHHSQSTQLQASTNKKIVMADASGLANTDKKLLHERSMQKRAKPAATVYETVALEPEYGFNTYKLYVENNLRRLEELATAKNKNKEVEVSFDVLPDGRLANFKIERSDCSRCNEEAIRILKDGPRWKSGAQKTGRTSYTIQF